MRDIKKILGLTLKFISQCTRKQDLFLNISKNFTLFPFQIFKGLAFRGNPGEDFM